MTKSELMSTEREIQLVRQLPNKRALDELVLANVGLVHKIVHKFPIKNAGCGYEDLYHAGIEGLIYGIQKFDVTRGYRLSTYCYRWIQAYVSRYFQNHGKTIRIPVHVATQQMKDKKVVETLTRDLGRTPTDEEIRDIVGEPAQTVGDCLSLNQMISDNDEMEALQGEDNTEDIDNALEVDILLNRVKGEVSQRDYNILLQRFGLEGNEPHSLSEIADKAGITRARSHQVIKEMIAKLRAVA